MAIMGVVFSIAYAAYILITSPGMNGINPAVTAGMSPATEEKHQPCDATGIDDNSPCKKPGDPESTGRVFIRKPDNERRHR